MNDVTNKEKQFEEAGKRRIVIDSTPYTVVVFFRTDTKETGMGKIKNLAKRELLVNPLPESLERFMAICKWSFCHLAVICGSGSF